RQLVDIGIRALSPAINDPTTASQVVDRIVDVLAVIAHQHRRPNAVTDRDGAIRMIVPRSSWPEICDLAFTELRVYGASSPQVSRRLMSAFDLLEDLVPDQADIAIQHHRRLLRVAVARKFPDPEE